MFNKIRFRLRINPLGVAMPGPRLPQRVRAIFKAGPLPRISRARAASILAICAALCAAFIAVNLTRAQSSATEDWEKAAGGKMSFDVASVKRNNSGANPIANFPLDSGNSYPKNGGLLRVVNFPLWSYIGFAYKLNGDQRQALRSELAPWAANDGFDIEARAAAGTNPTKDQMRLMMQSLLAERFNLKIHMQSQEMHVLALVLAKPGVMGPQLQVHSDDPPCTDAPGGDTTPRGFPAYCGILRLDKVDENERLGARNVTLAYLAGYLPTVPFGASFDAPVVDQTGLIGNFDFSFTWTPDLDSGTPALAQASGASFLEGLKDQLGLKLESKTAAIEAIVIDHIEQPTPN